MRNDILPQRTTVLMWARRPLASVALTKTRRPLTRYLNAQWAWCSTCDWQYLSIWDHARREQLSQLKMSDLRSINTTSSPVRRPGFHVHRWPEG